MATKRRIRNEPADEASEIAAAPKVGLFSPATGMRVATAMTAAAIVYVAYWTQDSILVQQGSARYLVVWLIVATGIACTSFGRGTRIDRWIDLVVWGIAGWMTMSLLVHTGEANVRLGINELGWWLATAALLTLARRVTANDFVASSLLRLIMAVAVGVAVFGWHQVWIGFPNMIAEYQADPEAMLRKGEIVAAKGSAARVAFENRLYDGGPTGTFALANSLAVLLVGGLVTMIGSLAVAWKQIGTIRRAAQGAAIIVVAGMLVATRSRSAIAALALLIGWLALAYFVRRSELIQLVRSRWRTSLSIGAALLLGVATIGYVMRNSEWVQQAPASLVIRFNYWRACFEMIDRSPWFGVGPGQFRSAYESFRAAASTEQIADPHQFLLQTMTCGGIPALALLVVLLCLLAKSFRRCSRSINLPRVNAEHRGMDSSSSGVMLGVLIALAGVWLIGLAIGQLPIVDPAVIATLVAISFSLIAWYGLDGSQTEPNALQKNRMIAGYAVITMGIDMLASGGMTVPGISVVAWTLIAIAVPVASQHSQRQSEVDRPVLVNWIVVGGTVVLLVAWYAVGISPIERTTLLQQRFETAWQRGQVDVATTSLEEAALADRWDAAPVTQLASAYSSLAIAQPERRDEWEVKWLAAESTAIARANHDPVVMKQLGDARLFHYQRYGDRAALETAEKLYARAIELSPSHETYAAQWAEVLRELGDDRASAIASRAAELSRAGGYYERSLGFIMILPARFYGSAMKNLETQKSASELLSGLLPESN